MTIQAPNIVLQYVTQIGGAVAQEFAQLVASLQNGFKALVASINALAITDWTDAPYAASNFRALSGGVFQPWVVKTADIGTYRYRTIGKSLFINLSISGTNTMPGATILLRITLPPPFVVAKSGYNFLKFTVGGVFQDGYITSSAGSTFIVLHPYAGTFGGGEAYAAMIHLEIR